MLALSHLRHNDGDVYPGLIEGLRAEFHHDDVELVAAWFLEAEADDFRWDGRTFERELGPCEVDCEEAGCALDRVAIMGVLAGRWYSGTACVDGDGRLWAMHYCVDHGSRAEALRAFQALV